MLDKYFKNSNQMFLVIIGIISALLIADKIRIVSGSLIIISALVGYSVTKDLVLSLSIAFILGNIFVSLNSLPRKHNKRHNRRHIEKFKDDKDDKEEDNKNEKEINREQIDKLSKDAKVIMKEQKKLIESLNKLKKL